MRLVVPSGNDARVEEIAVVVAHSERVTLRAGDVLLVPWKAGEYVYTVEPKGTLWAAARAAYGRADKALVDRIVAWNGGDPRRVLRVGQRLYCPR